MKIAVLGGTFDPVHMGHMAMAKAALEQLDVDEVWFMPARLTPLKDHPITNAQDRLAMLSLALRDEEKMKICTLELEREGKSYTCDTLKALHEKYPQDEFIWLIGADQAAQFDQWKEPDTILSLAQIASFERNGQHPETIYPMRWLKMTPVPVSSSQIRKGQALGYVDAKVLDYIYDHLLYVYDIVHDHMSDKRYHHSLMVAAITQALAVSNHLDGKKAYLMGLLHDIAKYMPVSQQILWMEKIAPEHMHYDVPVWHGFIGAAYVKEMLRIEDEDIYEAIWHHVLGTSTNPYAMALFCADKLEPLRPYDSSHLLKLCMNDLKAGFEEVSAQNQTYVAKQKKEKKHE